MVNKWCGMKKRKDSAIKGGTVSRRKRQNGITISTRGIQKTCMSSKIFKDLQQNFIENAIFRERRTSSTLYARAGPRALKIGAIFVGAVFGSCGILPT